jgi:hypothetical protein
VRLADPVAVRVGLVNLVTLDGVRLPGPVAILIGPFKKSPGAAGRFCCVE